MLWLGAVRERCNWVLYCTVQMEKLRKEAEAKESALQDIRSGAMTDVEALKEAAIIKQVQFRAVQYYLRACIRTVK